MIEIYRKSPDEARQGPVPSEYEHGRARGEEGPGSAILGRDDQWKRGHHRRRMTTEDDQAEKYEGWPKATFKILMAKYKEGRADIRGHKNWTI
jgi:hypothetical protein